MRIAFMGTPAFAVPTLDALIGAGHDVVAVYTQPPRPAGRGKSLVASPVQRQAEAAGIPLYMPPTLRDESEQARFSDLGLDVAVVAAYGLILPEPILAAPRHGCLNVHASLLPRWRGAAPIQRAIIAGDDQTGICVMAMERGLDTGPVFARRATDIDGKTAGMLGDELAAMGAALMVEVLERIGDLKPKPQPADGVTYAAKIDKSEARIDFAQPASVVERQIRAFNPVPGAYFDHGGERIKLLAATVSDLSGPPGTILDSRLAIACGSGAIIASLVQRAGRAVMRPDEMLRGFVIPVGSRLA